MEDNRTLSDILLGFMITLLALNLYLSFQIKDISARVKNYGLTNEMTEFVPDSILNALEYFGITSSLFLLEMLVLDGIVNVYVDSKNKIKVMSREDGSIISIKVVNDSDKEISRIQSLVGNSDFCFKRINDGYVLEPK